MSRQRRIESRNRSRSRKAYRAFIGPWDNHVPVHRRSFFHVPNKTPIGNMFTETMQLGTENRTRYQYVEKRCPHAKKRRILTIQRLLLVIRAHTQQILSLRSVSPARI